MEQLKFYDKDHEEFYKRIIEENNLQNDCYRKSLFYLLGLTEDTRNHCKEIYDFKEKGIETAVIDKPWQTSTSLKITRLAFNLYNGYYGRRHTEETAENTEGLDEKDKTIRELRTELQEKESRLEEARKCVVDEIFSCREFAPYFYEAIKIRFEMIK